MLAMRSDEDNAYARLNEMARNGSLRVVCAHAAGTAEAAEADALVAAQAGGMESTGVMLLVKVAERGLFTRAERLLLNGISGFVGPAPNERLGLVDVLVTGGMVSGADPAYTGADLFVDLLNDREIALDCLSQEQTRHTAATRLSIMEYARLTVYSMDIDPALARHGQDSLFAGAAVMLNGGRGVILGSGALAARGKPALSCAADCFVMERDLMLPKRGALPARHTLAMLFPLWKDKNAKALLKAAANLAAARGEEDAPVLCASETCMAKAVAGGSLAFADPGPKPYRTIMARA